MVSQTHVQAAPPDDGGHIGSYTEPHETVLQKGDDMSSIESIGNEPFKEHRVNRGLAAFWLTVLGGAVLIVLFAYARGLV